MKVRVKWVENVCFLAETESGHAIVMDGAPEGGGRNLGPRPMQTVLAGTGGCSGGATTADGASGAISSEEAGALAGGATSGIGGMLDAAAGTASSPGACRAP